MSRLGLVGNVRLRIVAQWIVWGEEGADKALVSGVMAWRGGPRMTPLGRARLGESSSSAEGAMGSPTVLSTTRRVSPKKRWKRSPPHLVIFALLI